MTISYTKHAREMLAFRSISQSLVTECIKEPDQVLSAREGKYEYRKNFGKNDLVVIVSKEKDSMLVITLHWLAKTKRKL